MWKIPLPFVFISYFSIYPTIIKPPRTLGPAQQDKKFGYGPHVQISNESSWQWDEAQSWHQYLRSSIQAYLSPLFFSVCLFFFQFPHRFISEAVTLVLQMTSAFSWFCSTPTLSFGALLLFHSPSFSLM